MSNALDMLCLTVCK